MSTWKAAAPLREMKRHVRIAVNIDAHMALELDVAEVLEKAMDAVSNMHEAPPPGPCAIRESVRGDGYSVDFQYAWIEEKT